MPKLARLIADDDKRRALLQSPLGGGGEAEENPFGAPPPPPPPPPPGGGSGRPPMASQTSFYEDGGGGGGGAGEGAEEAEPSDLAVDLDALPPNVKQVKEMFPDLPVPAIQAALQKASVQSVIEAALAGQVDPDAVPTDTGSKSGGKGLSGRCVDEGEGEGAC